MNDNPVQAQAVHAQAARARREFMRWLVLLAANINRPVQSTQRFLLQVIQAEYPDVTALELRRELDYLASRELLVIHTDPLNNTRIELTRDGVDVAEYTVDVEAGIMRPPYVSGFTNSG
jgi:hypothetical protein